MQKVYSPGRLFYEDRFSYQLKLIFFTYIFEMGDSKLWQLFFVNIL